MNNIMTDIQVKFVSCCMLFSNDPPLHQFSCVPPVQPLLIFLRMIPRILPVSRIFSTNHRQKTSYNWRGNSSFSSTTYVSSHTFFSLLYTFFISYSEKKKKKSHDLEDCNPIQVVNQPISVNNIRCYKWLYRKNIHYIKSATDGLKKASFHNKKKENW